MCRSLWQTPAALTLISTCVPVGCGVGWSTSFSGALKSATWKLFIVLSRKTASCWARPCHVCPVRTNAVARGWYSDQRVMAGGKLPRRDHAQFRHFGGASGVRAGTTRAEAAARGRRDRRRRFAHGDGLRRAHVGIGNGNGLDQQRGIGMRRLGKQLLGRADFAE